MDERRDDWRHGVDENLASLNAGQLVWSEEVKRIRADLEDIDRLIRGDAEEDTDGVMARMHSLETTLRMLEAVVLTDKAGNPGLQGRVSVLEGKKDVRVARWAFYSALLGMIAAIAVAIITNLDNLHRFIHPPVKSKPARSQRHPRRPLPEPELEIPEGQQ